MSSGAYAKLTPELYGAGTSDVAAAHYEMRLSPGRVKAFKSQHDKQRRESVCVEVSSPVCVVKGWLLPPVGTTVRGLRAVREREVYVARRKQLRPEVLQIHRDRPDALESGFSLELTLRPGRNLVLFQYKDDQKVWHTFCQSDLRLPYFWWMRRSSTAVNREPANAYEEWRHSYDQVADTDLEGMRLHAERFTWHPLISVLMPVYNPPVKWLRAAVESVRKQAYPHWELCIADDRSPDPQVRQYLESLAAQDPRIKVIFREENGHICKASNSALELCDGDFTALLDHDDELALDALYHVAHQIVEHPDVSLLFSDEDKVDEWGARSDPYFKPGWDPDLMLSQNTVCHLAVFRTSLLRSIGGFRPGLEGSQDWDLTLRAVAQLPRRSIRHIPRTLYHWRILPTSTAAKQEAKPYTVNAGRRAVADFLELNQPGAALQNLPDGSWRVVWPLPVPVPRASIVICTKDRVDLLQVAVDTLLRHTAYPDYEIIIVDHDSQEEVTREYLEGITAKDSRIRIIRADGPFNWSRLNNLGAAEATGSVLVFLNNDVEITEAGWLDELVRQVSRPEIGAVGAALFYPHGRLQHAGVVLGMTGVAGHVFRDWPLDAPTMAGRADRVREVTAVTGACMAVRRDEFINTRGFDEKQLPISYNDVDFCLRLRSMGLRNLYTPFARMTHHESASRAEMEKRAERKAMATEEARVILSRWPAEFVVDTCYNPRLSREQEIPSCAALKLPTPWQAEGIKNP